ncbi:efflux RND transporter periplasmic adaptor subunit [Chryseolinea lacunae]|uniref:Efflux RND transporter periplasmic adaptor subunit n=1 Tax=Chryseolinea lacunae TaxID=2801331 RepID=A0ABS1L039_9BACT|nr:efflux RND transporter periplasmic adaptor subunit [Chryseolinea lacunae]MBL0745079.1 efflux RND transporter periplasmic adaptor subunit [Chryseolinea lacunae]
MTKLSSFILTFFVLTLLAGCQSSKPEAAAAPEAETPLADEVELTDPQYASADITWGKIEPRALSGAIVVNGMLDVPPQNLVSISAPLGGFLKSTELLQGRAVKKGEVVAVMESTEYIQLQQDYLDQKSQLDFLEEEFKRQEALSKENVNATKTLQQASSSYRSMLAKVSGLKSKLQLINIDAKRLEETSVIQQTIPLYTPISGFVTEVNANIGMYVAPTHAIFKIVDTRHLHAELTVFEKDVLKLKIGQKVRFVLANESRERTATIHLIGREISEQRTVRVHCHLDNEDTDLLPGMYLTAHVETASHETPSLPDQAIVTFDGKKYIFIAAPGAEQNVHRFKIIEITTGFQEQGFTEVTVPRDFVTGSPVVIKGAYDLLGKMKNSEEEE